MSAQMNGLRLHGQGIMDNRMCTDYARRNQLATLNPGSKKDDNFPMSVDDLLGSITTVDESVRGKARDYSSHLLKAPCALGRLEALGAQLSALSNAIPPDLPQPAAIVVFAADHGLRHDQPSRWPTGASAQMTRAMCNGTTAVTAIARSFGATVVVVDVGLIDDIEDVACLRPAKVRRGTGDIRIEAAMTVREVEAAMAIGAEVAEQLIAEGVRCLVPAELAIGGRTAANALVATMLGEPAEAFDARRPLALEVVGHRVLTDVLARCNQADDPVELLADIGGLEIAAMVGFLLGAAEHRVPVVLDGPVALSAALVTVELCPSVRSVLVVGHDSDDPAVKLVLDRLRLEPILDVQVFMGDGTGAVLALPLLLAAATAMREMATFESAGISAIFG